MTHHVSLKGIICEALTNIKISKEEVKESDPNASAFFNFPHEEMVDEDTDIEIDEANDDDKKIHQHSL